ncbi:hypothetical protein E2562_027014 [Oryza meyeriana var. granulata]|uniref:Uncharacterized protein n=1 Tax=Oryza meyeriana var. granulata TaxID=110450 RepID=A0A6G1EPW0_9ORYZ|nr:hypothetical protein E2562_027014 [Oryza meyeriana var. granulata]
MGEEQEAPHYPNLDKYYEPRHRGAMIEQGEVIWLPYYTTKAMSMQFNYMCTRDQEMCDRVRTKKVSD